ncbi:hypothetical protein [Nocardia macrotermitis]|uniref:Uncharacterized protein n=1 Tax=Nocardia macrotermitis TaxID=2585198 RepID=A0A7K0DD80_9NOCA|nr:hypothetical protein [Nocardia macrotermitis]MQY23750.1 hypothetical protein [Nocardia macrotermitis]
MNLRTLLHRQADSVPLLPVSETEHIPLPRLHGKRARAAAEERLERLLTPTERDIVEHREPHGS